MRFDKLSNHSSPTRTRYRNALLLGCATAALLSPSFALSQEADNAGSDTTLKPIVLQGKGISTTLDTGNDSTSIVATETTGGGKMPEDILTTPASVSVITSKEMQERNASSVEQVLQYTAGVSSDFYGTDDRFDYFKIRGFDAYMYRDGLILGSPFGGLREETFAYERVEVLKGANSAGFGVSDPGGSVNFVTKRPKSERFGEAYVTGGSFNHAEAGIDFGDNITEDDTLSYRITSKVQKGEQEYAYSHDDEKFFLAGLTWRPDADTNVTLTFDHLDRDGSPGSGYPVGSNYDRSAYLGEPDYDYRDINRNSVGLNVDHDFGGGLSVGANARYSKARTNFGYVYIGSTPTDGSTIADRYYFGNESSSEQFVIDGHALYEANFNDVESRSLVGLEYNSYKSTSANYWSAAPGIDWTNPIYTGAPDSVALISDDTDDQKTKAIYVQENLTFFDRLSATVGLRNDWLDLSETNNMAATTASADVSEFTTRLGLSYKITDEVAVYASYAESVAPPATGVDPETGKQYEIGIKYRPTDFPALFSASIYDLTKENITVTNPSTLLSESIGEVRHRGVDLEAKAEITRNVSLIASYSYIDSEIGENGTAGNEGNRLQLVPKHLASAWATYTLPGDNGLRGDMTFGLGARYTGSYYFDDANTVASKGAVVFDASFSYKIQPTTTFQLNVSNLFDEKHVAYGGFGSDAYNPGRTIMATLRQTW